MVMPNPPSPFSHWMLAEIFEQPQSLQATLDRYVAGNSFREDTTADIRAWLASHLELLIVASGSSRHAGLLGMMLTEAESPLRVAVDFASEYGARVIQAKSRPGIIAISQSGETADTLAALRAAKEHGLSTLVITNVSTSTMVHEADLSMPVEAGRERAIPATKSFTGQLLVLRLMSLLAAKAMGTLDETCIGKHLEQLTLLPRTIADQLKRWHDQAGDIAGHFQGASRVLFLGRGIHYPIALEGALKLKESAYIHAEGYPAGELKHGPSALVSKDALLVFLAAADRADENSLNLYSKTLLLMRDMRAQGASIIALGNSDDAAVEQLADVFIALDPIFGPLLPTCEVVPLQLLAYCFAVQRGIDVDRPRNLVKAVVEE